MATCVALQRLREVKVMRNAWKLCVILMAAVCAGCGGGEAALPETQQATADDIRALEGIVSTDPTLPDAGVVAITLQGTAADDALIARLGVFPELKRLSLNGTKITDAAVPHLAKLQTLLFLDVRDTKLSDKARAALRGAFDAETVEVLGADEFELGFKVDETE